MPIPGTVPFTGLIAPTATTDTYALTDPIYGKDGLRSVADHTERDAVSTERRREGMLVYTQNDGKYWRLGSDLTTWTEFTSGGGGGGGVPGGSDKQVQFNDSGAFGGNAGFTYDKVLKAAAIGAGTNAVVGANSVGQGEGCLAGGNDSFASGITSMATSNWCFSSGNAAFAGMRQLACSIAGGNTVTISGVDYTNDFTTRAGDILLSGLNGNVGPTEVIATANDVTFNGTNTVITLTAAATTHTAGFVNSRSVYTASHAESEGTAYGLVSHAEGGSTAYGDYSHAEGESNSAVGEASHAENVQTLALGDQSHAEGHFSVASGNNCHAEGLSCISGMQPVACTISGVTVTITGANYVNDLSTLDGDIVFSGLTGGTGPRVLSATASDITFTGGNTVITLETVYTTHTSGKVNSKSASTGCHAEGSSTIATNGGHAEGGNTRVTGPQAHAEGNGSTASGASSHAGGVGSTAYLQSQFARSDGGGTGQYSVVSLSGLGRGNVFLGIGGSGGGSNFVIPSGKTWGFTVIIIGRTTDGAQHAMFTRQGMIHNDAGVVSLVGSVTTINTDNNTPGWTVALTANDTRKVLEILVHGDVTTSTKWLAKVDFVEVS